MKLASYRHRNGADFGVLAGDGFISLRKRLGHEDLRDFLARGSLQRLREIAERDEIIGLVGDDEVLGAKGTARPIASGGGAACTLPLS